QSIVNLNQGVPQLATSKTFVKQIAQRKKIAERFGHLLSFDKQMSIVQPVPNKLFSIHALRLRDLSLVMGKDVIDTTAVNIEFRPQKPGCHSAAFNVPAWSSSTPGSIPTDRTVLFIPCFPQSKIPDTLFLIFIVLYSTGRSQFCQVKMCQFAVVGVPANPKINRSVFGLVSNVLLHKLIDHFDHFRKVRRFSRSRKMICPLDSQRFDVLKKRLLKLCGKLGQRDIRFPATSDCFIVDVGQIHHPLDLKPPCFQVPLQKVFEYVRSEIPNMCKRVDRRTTSIKFNLWRLDRFKFF